MIRTWGGSWPLDLCPPVTCNTWHGIILLVTFCIKNRRDYNLIFGFVWSRWKEFFFLFRATRCCNLSPVMWRLFHHWYCVYHCRFQVRVMELVAFFSNCLVIWEIFTLTLCPRFLGTTRAFCLILARLFLNQFPSYSLLFIPCFIDN